jgi:hypothetical protein
MTGTRDIPLDRLVGRKVRAGNNRVVGRIEEWRAEMRGGELEVTGCVIGVEGLLERLGVGARMLVGRHRGGSFARWDQIDLHDPDHPRLRCRVDELDDAEVR